MSKLIPSRISWLFVVRLLLATGVIFYVFSRFIPCEPMNDSWQTSELDSAWVQALQIAFETHRQFGTDIVFTYGPWGFLACGYYPPTYLVSLTAWISLSLIFLFAGWRLACYFSPNRLMAGLWLVGFTAAASFPVEGDFNILPVAWGMLLLCHHFFMAEHKLTTIKILLAISLGCMGLVKFTNLIEGVIVIAVIAADNVFRQRCFPWIVAAWLGSLLFFWIAAGQQLNLLGSFLVNSLRITSGYTEAMMLSGKAESRAVIYYLLLAALLSLLFGRITWLRFRSFAVLPMIALEAILFIVFKISYVRYGWEHETTSAMALVLISLVCLAVTRRNQKRLGVAAACLVVCALSFASSAFNLWHPGNGMDRQLIQTFSLTSMFAPEASACTGYLRNDFEKNLEDERKAFPSTTIKGSADVYSYDQIFLFAKGITYQPRPVIQSYSAYTPELAAMNSAHLRSRGTADNILFAIQPIDGRFPALEDGLSWPELLTLYDIKSAVGDPAKYLLLSQTATPRTFHQIPFQNVAAHFGETVAVPAAVKDPVWVEITIKKSLTGKLVSLLYKPPVLMLDVTLKDNTKHSYRLIPGMASGGFLLSPLIADSQSFAVLASTGWQQYLAGSEIASMTILAATRSGSTLCYQTPMTIRYYRLEYPLQVKLKKDSKLF